MKRTKRKRRYTPEQSRKWNLSQRYGITPTCYKEMLDRQNGVCALCGGEMARPVVDHCHVTGLFSTHHGRDFAAVVGEMAGCEFDVPTDGWEVCGAAAGPDGMVEWSVLDAQFWGVAQRRRRVFLVRDTGNWASRPPVLFERESLSGHPAPGRRERQRVAPPIAGCSNGGGANGPGRDVDSVESLVCMSSGQANAEVRDDGGAPSLTCLHEAPIVAHSLRADGFDASEDGTGRGTPLVPVGFNWQNAGGYGNANEGLGITMDGVGPLQRCQAPAVAFDTTQITSAANRSNPKRGDPCHPLAAGAHPPAIATTMQVRRLTPRECERLQGFPDDYTLIPVRGKPAADGPRYKSLGNSMCVNVMRWLGERINLVESIP